MGIQLNKDVLDNLHITDEPVPQPDETVTPDSEVTESTLKLGEDDVTDHTSFVYDGAQSVDAEFGSLAERVESMSDKVEQVSAPSKLQMSDPFAKSEPVPIPAEPTSKPESTVSKMAVRGNSWELSEEEKNAELNSDEAAKFNGGYGNGKIDADKLAELDLPTYTAPPLMNTGGVGVGGKASKNRTAVYRIVAILFAALVVFGFYKIAVHFTGSGGKDITEYLTKTEDEIAKDFNISFSDNTDRVRAIPQYSGGTVTVKSGDDLHIVYINNKQVGVNTDSRQYRFFNVGINDAEQTAIKKMTYKYDNSMVVMNDLLGGNSETIFYYNKKNNDCLALTVSDATNRVVNMTYYTNYKKITENLSTSSE